MFQGKDRDELNHTEYLMRYCRAREYNFQLLLKEHGKFVTCQCGDLCKKINISKMGFLPVHKFVCINQNNKLYPGCKVSKDC